MKTSRALMVVTAIAALSLSSQAFARGGGMGGAGGGAIGSHSMNSTMPQGGGSMLQGPMQGARGQDGTMAGNGPHSTGQGSMGSGTGHQHGPKHGNGNGPQTP